MSLISVALLIFFFIQRFLRRRGCPGLISLGWSLAWALLQVLSPLMMGRTVNVRVAPPFSDLMAVLTFDPRNVEHVLKHNFANYPKGHHFTSTFQDPSLAQGIFNVDGSKWREQF
uniref:Cytochrome P450 n=1 Tax=Kalanchoe fedtschenkoi TaxID=63787 RepID=A0A7N0VF69_KALFE